MASVLSNDNAAPVRESNFRWDGIKTLFRRKVVLSTVWLATAVFVVGFFISHIYRENAERNFLDLLRAELYNVINSVTISDQGLLVGSPQLGDLRFAKLATGWYWLVEPLGDYTEMPLVSSSIGATKLPVSPELEVPFDENYERYYGANDDFGNHVFVVETEVVLDTRGRSARFRVAGNAAVIEDDVRAFTLELYLSLIGFGLSGLLLHALVRQSGRNPS